MLGVGAVDVGPPKPGPITLYYIYILHIILHNIIYNIILGVGADNVGPSKPGPIVLYHIVYIIYYIT